MYVCIVHVHGTYWLCMYYSYNTFSGHTNAVSGCSFSANDHYVCTSSWDKTIRVYDVSTGSYR